MRIHVICRVCLKEGSMKPIFKTKTTVDDKEVSCSDMLMACASIEASPGDGFPDKICFRCFKKLNSAFTFRRLCEKSLTCLLSYVARNIDITKIKEEKIEEFTINDSEINLESDIDQESVFKGEILRTDEFHSNNNLDDVKFNINDLEDYGSPLPFVSSEDIIKRSRGKKKSSHDTKRLSEIIEPCNNDFTTNQRKIKRDEITCSFCPKIFKRPYLLLAHQDSHMGIKRYFCELCKKSYRSEKDHKNMHKRGFKYKCDVCKKDFNTNAKLRIHIATHNKNREKTICGLNGCTKLFMSAVGLDRHRSLHDGLKNFICHFCSKRFIDKYMLESHVRRHTNERRYPCNYCEKKFFQSSARLSHERRHTNTKNYNCSQCEKNFVCSSELKRHMLSHNKELPEICRFCGKKFSRADNRNRHETVMHRVSRFNEENT